MNKYSLQAPLHLRRAFVSDSELSAMITTTFEGSQIHKIYPLVAPNAIDGNFILYAREGYKKKDTQGAGGLDTVTINVNAISDDYDTSLKMLNAIRRIIIEMRNQGYDVDFAECEEDTYGYSDEGASQYVQIVKVECTNFPKFVNSNSN